ncbi:hypothetical protein BJ875DRAFT_507341 [Amylocarpus encephaloides]|uniref:Aquaporin-like protein n=1 Tax=Amylocarpus encephaloides TaxID=45428 RepID=A0A9P7YBH6_9HELO|nr:hypothetical protein BJ875DRAFT_507341 [Amylocarpus encephaloides]
MGTSTHRLHTNDMEIGLTDAIQRYVHRHMVAPKPISQRKLDFEHSRPRYHEPAFGSLFQIGISLAFAVRTAFASITCCPISGGHFNPAITISVLLLIGQYHPQVKSIFHHRTGRRSWQHHMQFPGPTQTNYGYLFMTEFFADSFIGIIIWAVDPTNTLVAPASVSSIIDLGMRIVTAIFYSGDDFGDYEPIAILVNVLAIIFATGVYVILRVNVHEHGEEGLIRHRTKVETIL